VGDLGNGSIKDRHGPSEKGAKFPVWEVAAGSLKRRNKLKVAIAGEHEPEIKSQLHLRKKF